MEIKIPIYKPSLSGNEKKYVNECLDSTWISSKGSFIEKFETRFSEYLGIKYSASVSNGTVALHLALLALGIQEGDEVIVPSLTYIASVNAISYTGATPVFIDSRVDTWQLDVDNIVKHITPKTKAVMAVHLYGHPCEMEALAEVCNKHSLFLIEDCAEAFGSKYRNQYVGTFGHIATFSFFGNKTITTGEGGMVSTNDLTLHDRVMHYKGQGLAKYREYWHDVIGYNYRMTNICAAIGLAQLEQADVFIKQKIAIAERYRLNLEGLPIVFHNSNDDVKHTYWMCSMLVANASLREPLRIHLSANGIETRPLFYPIHTMPMYARQFQHLPVAEDLAWRGINLPSFPLLKPKEIDFITEKIRDFLI